MSFERLLGEAEAGRKHNFSVAVHSPAGSLEQPVDGVHGGIQEDVDHGGGERTDLHHKVDSVVGSHGHSVSQHGILKSREDVEGKKFDAVGEGAVVHQPMSSEGLHARALNLASCIDQLGVLCLLDRRLEERVHGGRNIDGAVEVHEVLRDGYVEVVYAYPPLPIRCGVKQSTLDADVGAGKVLFLVHEVAAEGLVEVAGGQSKEVSSSEIVVAVEGLHFDPARCSHA
mmetsp:Transcript_30198/g.68318  ORF Transcript_30198/g.68318 Transcript_30198/m.68318 type:complete len:228 (-) Transcript_30198:2174-2857(-)